MRSLRWLGVWLAWLGGGGLLAHAETLSLDAYARLVEQNHPAIAAAGWASEAAGRQTREAYLVYAPMLNAAYRFDADRSGATLESPLQANEIISQAWRLSLSKRFSTGTLISAGCAHAALTLDLPSPYPIDATTLLSRFTAYDLQPYVRLEQSLLKELFGGMTEAGIRKSELRAESGHYLQMLNRQQVLLNARAAYLRLSLCREAVKFRKEALARADEILRWNNNKMRLDLADTGELLQAQAQRCQSALELQNALDDEKRACRDFNRHRNLDSETVGEDLQNLPELLDRNLAADTLQRSGQRADVLSARAGLAGSEAASAEARWRVRPELTAFGQASWHGLHTDSEEAWRQAAEGEKPAYAVGAELTWPLDFVVSADAADGYELERRSSAALLQDAEAASETDWKKLCDQWVRVKANLAAAREVRDLQARRVEYERSNYRRGKTTTWQVFMAENDLDQATLNLQQVRFEGLMTLFQAELYNTQTMPGTRLSAGQEVLP